MPRSSDDTADIKAAVGVVLGDGNEHLGTCFRVTRDLALTCVHVAGATERPRIRFGGTSTAVDATIEDRNDDADALLLRCPAQLSPPLRLATVTPRVGAEWTTFGFPAIASNGVRLVGTINELHGLDTKGRPSLVLECPTAKHEYVHGLSGSPVLYEGAVIGHLKRIVSRAKGDPAAAFGFLYATSIANTLPLVHEHIQPRDAVASQGATAGSGPERPVRTLTLRVIGGGVRGAARKFELDTIRVGRASASDLQVLDEHVSQQHGEFFFRDSALHYRDTSRGGSAITSNGETHPIAFEEIVEVPLFATISLADSGISVEVTGIGRGKRKDS